MHSFLHEQSSKYQTIKHVYYCIHKYGPLTKGELLELTKIKRTTLVRHLEELMNSNYIQISQYDKSTGGRPPALYQVNPRINYIIGIDLSRTKTDILLLDLNFKTVDSYSFLMTIDYTPEVTISLIKTKITNLLKRHDITNEQLLGIGVGSVGPLDREKGIILDPQFFLAPGWTQVPFVKELQDAFDTKVLIENGANAAALGEYVYTSVYHSTYLYCISGIGLRCGVLTNGQFMKNNTGDASAFGEMIIDLNQSDTYKNNTLSSFISLDSILEETKKRMLNGETSLLKTNSDNITKGSTIEDLFIALRKGDTLIQEVVLKSAYFYGVGLANIINIIHPEKIILSGKLIDEYPSYYDKVIETAKQYIYRFDEAKISFGVGQLENAVSIGASVLIFNSYFDRNHSL
ncbi:ROK family protein [Aquibacillus halophilus]|uniref:ROK family protein n=1 Tax=Aquibacillus halophilus TaxID=930132 RepID=A0A6A8DFJ6_9BACI|nr:ROK family protein [Aquibacillus halophilus]MRH43306.1 ROK family protein [Aquibacillus halophilus]